VNIFPVFITSVTIYVLALDLTCVNLEKAQACQLKAQAVKYDDPPEKLFPILSQNFTIDINATASTASEFITGGIIKL